MVNGRHPPAPAFRFSVAVLFGFGTFFLRQCIFFGIVDMVSTYRKLITEEYYFSALTTRTYWE